MKCFLLISCGFAAIFVTADARNPGDTPDGRCAETRSWKEDCNSCSCDKGYYPHCTKMLCISTHHEVKHFTFCEPNEMLRQDCNECQCTSDGNELICTKRSCVSESPDDSQLKEQKEEPKSSVCEPNEVIQQNCNKCRCNSEGTDLICTKPACVSKIPDDVGKMKEQVNMRQVCEPNEPFNKECNRCFCNDEGSSYTCTQNFCVDDLPNDVEVFNNTEESDHSERQKVCVPNENFKRDCNTCKCNQDGTDFFCTRKFCLAMEDVEVMEKHQGDAAATFRALVCSPNESFQKNCNKCRCNKLGTAYSCTRKVCDTPSASDDMEAMEYRKQAKKAPSQTTQTKRKCEPRSVFKLDCNTCQCSDDGNSYYCTRRVCLPGIPDDYDENITNDKSELISTPEQNRDKRDVVQTKYDEEIRSCRPGEEFRLDCNTCLCNSDGNDYACTRKDCQNQSVSKRSVDNDNIKHCVPGSVFRRGCSSCVCSLDGRNAACTDDACLSQNVVERNTRDTKSPSKPELVCKPGESTTRDCNTCVCSTDGRQLTCTEKSCSYDDLTQKEIAADDPDFRCTPGDQFKRECNDCTCSANGKGVFCTLKLCV